MSPWRWLVLACALLSACAGTPRDPSQAQARADGPELLVMFEDKVPPHFRPDGGGGGYGAPDARARVLAQARTLATKHHLVVKGDWPMPSLGIYCVLVHPTDDEPVEQLLKRLESEPGVAWAQTVQTFKVLAAQDPYYALQKGGPATHLDEMHALATGRDVTVAQIDTGVDLSHPDLTGRVAESANFVDGETWRAEAHGTAVAGIIAGARGNQVGIVGVAPDASLLALRACRESASGSAECSTFSLGKAMEFAFQRRARVINLSLTGPKDRLISALLDRFSRERIVVVAAVDRSRGDGGFPASHPGVVAAGSRPLPGMERRPLVAPGDDILTALPGGKWGYVTGDSFATAHVSGLAALFAQRDRKLTGARFAALFPDPDRAALGSCAALLSGGARTACRCCPKAATSD